MIRPSVSDQPLFLIAVDGDIPDAQQDELRQGGLFAAGHVGMSASGRTREGSCTTFFNVLASTEVEAQAAADQALARFGRGVLSVELVAGGPDRA